MPGQNASRARNATDTRLYGHDAPQHQRKQLKGNISFYKQTRSLSRKRKKKIISIYVNNTHGQSSSCLLNPQVMHIHTCSTMEQQNIA